MIATTTSSEQQGEPFVSWHRIIDRRNLELARATADCVRADPRKLEIARANLQRLIERGVGGGLANRYIVHWKHLFETKDVNGVLAELERDDETGSALRQADPFTGILPSEARKEIMTTYESRRSAFTLTAGRLLDGPSLAPASR